MASEPTVVRRALPVPRDPGFADAVDAGWMEGWVVGGVWRLFGGVLGQALTSDRWRDLRSLRDNRPVP